MLSRQTFTTIACKMVNKRLENQGVVILDTFAEAFRMWCARIIVTACDEHWVKVAAGEVTGYGTSVIGCDAEAGVEQWLSAKQTPDGRPGVAILFFAFNAKALTKAVPNRVGQSLMTCPTTAVFDGLPDAAPRDEADESDKNEEVKKSGDTARIDVGKQIRFFGDGFQKSKVVVDDAGRSRRYWRVPVMDGEFTVEESVGACKAIGGGNILICGKDQVTTLKASKQAVDVITELENVIAPFPGGIVRSGSKVGSRYASMFASTNDAWCPTLRSQVESELPDGVGCVYEIVINGVTEGDVANAMRQGIHAACLSEIVAIGAGNYGGKLGKFHFKLHEVMDQQATNQASSDGEDA